MSLKKAGAIRAEGKLYIRSDMIIGVIKDFNKGLKPQIMEVIDQICEENDVDIRAMRKCAKEELKAHNDFTKDLVNTFERLFDALNTEMDTIHEEETRENAVRH